MKTRIVRIAAAGLAVLALTIGGASAASAKTAQPTGPQAADTSWT